MPSGTLSPQARSANVQFVGLPGEHEQIHLINRFVEGDPRNSIPISGAPGLYTVTFVLGRPGYYQVPERQFSFSNGLQGDSHLAIAKPAFAPPGNKDADRILVDANTEDGHFRFIGYPNQRGFLGKVVSEPFMAQNRQDAERKAYRALLPSLSDWSVHLDIPLSVFQLETQEVTTENIQTSILIPYLEAPFSVIPVVMLSAEFRGLASIYREALISNSPIYKFLCLYKIIEALRARRKRQQRAAKRSDTSYAHVPELLPTLDNEVVIWLNSLYPVHAEWDAMALSLAIPAEVRGLAIDAVVDAKLKPLRDNISHALATDSGNLTQSIDDLLHTHQVTRWLSFMKCVTRRMLKNDFPSEFLPYLGDDGVFRQSASG